MVGPVASVYDGGGAALLDSASIESRALSKSNTVCPARVTSGLGPLLKADVACSQMGQKVARRGLAARHVSHTGREQHECTNTDAGLVRIGTVEEHPRHSLSCILAFVVVLAVSRGASGDGAQRRSRLRHKKLGAARSSEFGSGGIFC